MFRSITQFWWSGFYAWAEALDSWSGPPDSNPWDGDAKVIDLDSERRRRVQGGAKSK